MKRFVSGIILILVFLSLPINYLEDLPVHRVLFIPGGIEGVGGEVIRVENGWDANAEFTCNAGAFEVNQCGVGRKYDQPMSGYKTGTFVVPPTTRYIEIHCDGAWKLIIRSNRWPMRELIGIG